MSHPLQAVSAEPITNQTRSARFWNATQKVSIRTKILGIVLVLTTVLGLGITWQVRSVMGRALLGELESLGLAVASDVGGRSVEPILLDDAYALYQLLDQTTANHPDVLYVFIVAEDGRILSHTFDDQGIPTELISLHEPSETDTVTQSTYDSDEGRVHDFALSTLDGSVTVRVGLTENRVQRAINGITGQMLVTTAMVGLVGIAAATVLTWLLTRPVLDLVESTRRVRDGDLATRASPWANDEIGVLAESFNDMVSDLEENRATIAENERMRSGLIDKLIGAQEDERKRIARELHDGIGQALSSMMLEASVISRLGGSDAIGARCETLQQLGMETLEQVRELGRELRPSALDDFGIVAALDRYSAEFARRYDSTAVDVHCDLPSRLPSAVETALYRIVQEAMTNAARHSGCTNVSVLVSRRNGHVNAIVEDNGVGFDPESARRNGSSVGLHAMTERAELLGGSVEYESGANGTTVYVGIPV